MKKIVISVLMIIMFVGSAHAEKIKVIDVTGWTQTQLNRAKSALAYALDNAGRDERPEISKTGTNEFTLTFPDTLPNGIFNAITAERILQEMDNIDAENAATEAAERSRLQGLATSIRSKLTNTTHEAWTDEEVDILFTGIRNALNY